MIERFTERALRKFLAFLQRRVRQVLKTSLPPESSAPERGDERRRPRWSDPVVWGRWATVSRRLALTILVLANAATVLGVGDAAAVDEAARALVAGEVDAPAN